VDFLEVENKSLRRLVMALASRMGLSALDLDADADANAVDTGAALPAADEPVDAAPAVAAPPPPPIDGAKEHTTAPASAPTPAPVSGSGLHILDARYLVGLPLASIARHVSVEGYLSHHALEALEKQAAETAPSYSPSLLRRRSSKGGEAGGDSACYGYAPAQSRSVIVSSDAYSSLPEASQPQGGYGALMAALPDAYGAVPSTSSGADGYGTVPAPAAPLPAAAQTTAATATATATPPSGPPGPPARDWFAEWLSACELPSTTPLERAARAVRMYAVSSEFSAAARTCVRALVDDLLRQPAERVMAAVGVGGIAGKSGAWWE